MDVKDNIIENEPQYNEKVLRVLKLLAQGKTREEAAAEMNYTSYKSMDQYVRRRNFIWDVEKQNYVPESIKSNDISFEESISSSSKVGIVISMFEKDNSDAKIIAKRLGFEDHRELASYMAGKGYEWSIAKKNYIRIYGLVESVKEDDSNKELGDKDINLPIQVVSNKTSISNDVQDFIPLLQMLEKYKDRLIDLIMPSCDTGVIPRYTLPGTFVTKSVHMVSPLDRMVRDYATEKNVTQRDIFAVALIEFFRKYGYDREIEHLINGGR